MRKGVVSIALAIVMLLSGLGLVASNSSGHNVNPQILSVEAIDPNGNPASNVSVQGIMQLPPSEGAGTTPAFLGVTGSNGIFNVNNTSYVHNLASKWMQYRQTHNNAFSPYIMVFLTYQFGNTTYTQQTSIKLTPGEIMKGESYHAMAHLIRDNKHKLVANPHVGNPRASNEATVSSSAITGGISNPLPVGWEAWVDWSNWLEPKWYYWGETNSSQVNGSSGQPLEIPLAIGEASGSGEVTTAEVVTATSYDETGSILNPYDTTNVQTTTGTQNGQNDGTYTIEVNYPNGSTHWNYAYMLGNFTVANYELFYGIDYPIIGWQYTFLDSYQTLMGISQIATLGSDIQGGVSPTEPPSYVNQAFMQLNSMSNQNPPGVQLPSGWYEVTSNDLAKIMSNYNELAGITIGIGAIILAVALISFPVAAVIAGIIIAALGIANTVMQWQSSNSLDVNAWVEYSTTDYGQNPTEYSPHLYVGYTNAPLVLNGNLVDVPTIFAYVYGQPLPSGGGGGGGCVLSGTSITLANGSTIPVQYLEPGMKALSYDVNNHELVTSTVTQVIESNVSQIMDINNGLLFISGMSDQPVFVKLVNGTEEWLTIGQLDSGMQLFNALNNTWINITSLSLHMGSFSVFDVNTARQFQNNKTVRSDYIADDVLVDIKIG